VTAYPLGIAPALAVACATGAVVWRWPAAALVIVPAALPAFDLGLWTGWMVIGESDLVMLAAIVALLVRAPPTIDDAWPAGSAGLVVLALALLTAVTAAIGLLSPLGYTGHSDNPFLRPDNALRLAKGLAEALILLPVIRRRQRTHGDALKLLGRGILAGLGVVSLEVLLERALFTGVLDFTSDYRVIGPFSSMRVGGGHIGAYLAMALPFLTAFGLHPRGTAEPDLTRAGSDVATPPPAAGRGSRSMIPAVLTLSALLLVTAGGLYALAVTYARTGYLAGAAGMTVASFGWLVAHRRQGRVAILAIVPLLALLAGFGAAASSGVMRDRFGQAAADLLTRESNWRAGWAVHDNGAMTMLFGMGLGTYQRAMLFRSSVNRPSDLHLGSDDQGHYVTLRTETPFYFGQKVFLPPSGAVRLTLRFRAGDAKATLGVSLCDKMLVYSDNCRGKDFKAHALNTWKSVATDMPVEGLGRSVLGLVGRPVELSLFGTAKGTTLDIRDVTLTDTPDAVAPGKAGPPGDAGGHSRLANGDFVQGLDRWLFTDDSHVSWRILNQYLMTLFETGAIGLAALLGVAGLAMAGGVRAAWRGNVMGSAVTGSILSFLVSGLFDNVLEAPRLATLFFLICWAGILLWEQPVREERRRDMRI
jgi:hypothetical protein